MDYEPTPGLSSSTDSYGYKYTTGRLAFITFPSGGKITYTYPAANDGVNCVDGTTTGFTKVTPDSSSGWTYTRAWNPAGYWTTTVNDPLGNMVSYNFDSTGTYELQHTVTDKTNGLLETVFTCYTTTETNCATNGSISPPINRRIVTTQLPDSSGIQSKVDTQYNGIGLPTEMDQYDFGASTATFMTTIAYGTYSGGTCNGIGTGTNILDRVCTVSVSDTNYQISFTSNVYDTKGNLSSSSRLTGGSTLVTSYQYDTNGAVNQSTVNGTLTKYTNNMCQSALPGTVTTTGPNGNLTKTLNWDCNGGVLTSVTDENSKLTTFNYADANGNADPFWRMMSKTVASGDPQAATTTYSYPLFPNNVDYESSLSVNGGASAVDVITAIDSLGRPYVTQKRGAPNTSSFDTVSTIFDADGRINKVSVPCPTTALNATCSGAFTTTAYDALNRVTSITDASNGIVSYAYTKNDVLQTLKPIPANTSENLKKKNLEFDGMGRLTSVCELTSATNGGGTCNQTTGPTGFWTTYTYDSTKIGTTVYQRTKVAQNAQSTSTQTRTLLYDLVGRLAQETNPENGTVTYSYDSLASDAACGSPSSPGDLVKRVDAAQNTTCYYHDSLHRLTDAGNGNQGGSPVCRRYRFDQASGPPSGITVSNAMGRVVEAFTDNCASPATVLTDEWFSYSSRGELTDVYESTPNSGGYYHTTASYFENGSLNTLSGIPGKAAWNYTVDGEGRLNSSANGETAIVSSTAYNAASQITGVTFASGDSDVYGYDNVGRMKSYQFNVGTQYVLGQPGWNANGTLGSLTIVTDPFNTANQQSCSYTYDDVARISSANCTNASGNVWSQQFSYDPFGNIQKTSPAGTGTVFTPTYTAGTNQMFSLPGAHVCNTTTGASVCYDANGNLVNDSFHTYTWDPNWGNPLSVDSVGLTYDALGRMVEQNRSGTTTQILYGPTGKLALLHGQTTSRIFAPIAGEDTTDDGGRHFHHGDWLGSSRLASTNTQTEYADTAYAPFGEEYTTTGTADLDFTGMVEDTVSSFGGLYDFMYREYAPRQGRWISPDPAGVEAANPSSPQSWNRYAYVMNNPLSFIDPDGLQTPNGSPCGPGGVPGNGGGGCNTSGNFPCLICGLSSWNSLAINWILDREGGMTGLMTVFQNSGGVFVDNVSKNNVASNNGIPVHRTFQRTFQCSSSASGLMNALESNFASFANNPASGDLSTFSIFTPGPVSPGGQIGINVGVQAGGHTIGYSDVSVTVQSATSSQLVFQSDPGHVLYPATVSFSASDAGNGSIMFTTSVNATTNGLWGTAQFYLLGGRAGETSTWNNLLSNVASFCAQSSHP